MYIGQSVNARNRWSAHKSEARLDKPTDHSILHRAMRFYGIENFEWRIIERTLNYNEREEHYIEYYDSLTPNGYNIALGGAGNRQSRTEEEMDLVANIKDEIKNSSRKLIEIAEDYGITLKRISAINRGYAYRNDKDVYPLRPRDNDVVTDEELEEIFFLLKETTDSMREIARAFGCNTSIIRDVNSGKKSYVADEDYPIRRKEQPEYVDKIIWDIQNTTMSLRAISAKYGLSSSTATNINTGRYYKNPDFSYPLRAVTK